MAIQKLRIQALLGNVLRYVRLRIGAALPSARDSRRDRRNVFASHSQRVREGEIPPAFENYDEYIRSSWWSMLRGHTLAYVRHRCEFCGRQAIQVHHVNYPSGTWGYESIETLLAVCVRCHEAAHEMSNINDQGNCAFCKSVADTSVSVAFPKYSRRNQRACVRCAHLAKGNRRLAKGWNAARYTEWVAEWKRLIPTLQTKGQPIWARLAEMDEFREYVFALSKEELDTMWNSPESELSVEQQGTLRGARRRAHGLGQQN